jgi:hypothetical protein
MYSLLPEGLVGRVNLHFVPQSTDTVYIIQNTDYRIQRTDYRIQQLMYIKITKVPVFFYGDWT